MIVAEKPETTNPRESFQQRPQRERRQVPWGRIRDGLLIASVIASLSLIYFYVRSVKEIDAKLSTGAYANTLNLYAAPFAVETGDALKPFELVQYLERSGYSPDRENRVGWYAVDGNVVEIHPSSDSRISHAGCVVRFNKTKIASIVSIADKSAYTSCSLEPRLIANLSERSREKRKPMTYSEFPQLLVQAVLAVEDKRFFKHHGVDFLRAGKAIYVDLKERRKEQGASTLTMQLVRSMWLEPDKKWRRKIKEMVMAMHVEEKMSKEQIFERYANEIYLGRHGTFSVHGFGEGSRAFFNKEPKDLTLPETALLAGLAQAPSVYNPFRGDTNKARDRRNIVLYLMKQNGFITSEQYRAAADAPLGVKRGAVQPVESPFLMDLVQDEVQKHIPEENSGYRVYTTVDLDLQRAAEEAVRAEIGKVDVLVRKTQGKKYDGTAVQIALVALDPRTGHVKAYVGGRDYAQSQLNRGLALRQPGSVFKPFVYAAALNTAVEGGNTVFTAASVVSDEPSTFLFNGQRYEPGNFHGAVYGNLTLRRALAKSSNVVTVKVAETVGYGRVASFAHRAGFNRGVMGTPSVALGAYEATPLEIAAAYTAFANQGLYVQPALVSTIQNNDGTLLYSGATEKRRVLDPRVAYLMVNMMEEVMRSGTAAGARSRGFTVPAAGKTGTSRDGWFAGFTSELVCVVWVGFDDNRDLKLEGSKTALPIWTEFMKRALKLPAYKDAKPFRPPSGIVQASIDPETGGLATEACSTSRPEYFIAGTAPAHECELHSFSAGATDAALQKTSQ